MKKFAKATQKISIKSLDDQTLVVAQYNPKELQIDKSVPWSKVNQANQSNERGIHLEFTGAEGRSMTIELLFDGYEDGGKTTNVTNESVSDLVGKLERLASVWKPESPKEDERRPHRCVAAWGTALNDFRCVIESLSTKYTMFSSDGVPLRATCTVKLKEADVVSMAKAAAGSGAGAPTGPAPTGGGTPGGGGTPRPGG
jgi:hypothetical protein